MYEFGRTIESLWSTVNGMPPPFPAVRRHMRSRLPLRADFITQHPEYVAKNSAMKFLSDNGGADYNLCHCTSFCMHGRRTAADYNDFHAKNI